MLDSALSNWMTDVMSQWKGLAAAVTVTCCTGHSVVSIDLRLLTPPRAFTRALSILTNFTLNVTATRD